MVVQLHLVYGHSRHTVSCCHSLHMTGKRAHICFAFSVEFIASAISCLDGGSCQALNTFLNTRDKLNWITVIVTQEQQHRAKRYRKKLVSLFLFSSQTASSFFREKISKIEYRHRQAALKYHMVGSEECIIIIVVIIIMIIVTHVTWLQRDIARIVCRRKSRRAISSVCHFMYAFLFPWSLPLQQSLA